MGHKSLQQQQKLLDAAFDPLPAGYESEADIRRNLAIGRDL
jgi:hypothetical protein